MRTPWRVCGLAALVWLLSALPSFAHAILVESAPIIDVQVAPGDIAIRLRFNSRLDRGRSRLTLIRADRSTQIVPIAPDGTDDLLLAQVKLAPGTYVVRWQVLAIDGHITRGDVPFRVGK